MVHSYGSGDATGEVVCPKCKDDTSEIRYTIHLGVKTQHSKLSYYSNYYCVNCQRFWNDATIPHHLEDADHFLCEGMVNKSPPDLRRHLRDIRLYQPGLKPQTMRRCKNRVTHSSRRCSIHRIREAIIND